jgi:uncharacterized damage-inducible protein DinB
MNEVLLELYRHKTWATLRLIEHCQSLDDAQLDATIPGTYGTIRDTLRHLVGAEERYFWEVTGNRLAEPFPDGPVPLAELAGRIRRFGPRWEALVRDADAPHRVITTPDRWPRPGRCRWPRPSTTPTTTAATSFRSSARAVWRSPTLTCGPMPRGQV